MLQTIHSKEIASSIDKRWKKDPLNVMLQVNTSGEEGIFSTSLLLYNSYVFISFHSLLYTDFIYIIRVI